MRALGLMAFLIAVSSGSISESDESGGSSWRGRKRTVFVTALVRMRSRRVALGYKYFASRAEQDLGSTIGRSLWQVAARWHGRAVGMPQLTDPLELSVKSFPCGIAALEILGS